MIDKDKLADDCPVLELYHLLGKKWTCPILMSIEKDKEYTFEDIIKLTSRQINRTLLSNLLKEMLEFDLIKYNDSYYMITDKGIVSRGILEDLKKLVLDGYSEDEICFLRSNCLVSTFKD